MFEVPLRWWILFAVVTIAFWDTPRLQAFATAVLSPRDILTEADKARGNLGGVAWELNMRTEATKGEREMTLEVQARGFDVVTTTQAPARSKGDLLIVFQNNMWFYKPGLSKPVPISKRQRLLGAASYGDVATTNYANDYEAVLLGEELVEGIPCWVYDLTALNNKVTYDRIKYWVDKDRLVGIKAEYYTVSGQKFKSARMEYDNRVKRDGELKPFISRIVIQGELLKNEKTVLTFSDPILRTIPDHTFNLDLITQ
ncbi:MAG: outer membrane lipoprotein-sorting protein [Candidatus Competibacteraceae bacterium]